MTEDEFRILEHRMAINRGKSIDQVRKTLGIAQPHEIYGGQSIVDSVEWPEHMIEAECTRLLQQDDWRAISTKPVSDRGRGLGFGELGMADHLYIRYHDTRDSFGYQKNHTAITLAAVQLLWVEFKSCKGKPSKHQIEWHTRERARGALTWIASVDFPASVAGFVDQYRESGLNRGRV
jgi:hypothetical protein